jgi:hypothetical protein
VGNIVIIFVIIVGAAFAGVAIIAMTLGAVDLVKRAIEMWADRREQEQLEKNPIGDVEEQRFYVKSTYAKYIMGEGSSQLTKLRVIRALQDVTKIRIDRLPTHIDKTYTSGLRFTPLRQQCYSMPGVALIRGDYYQVNLATDQIFKAKADYTYITSIKLLESLDTIHDNPNEDFIQIEKPLGTEEFVAEVHFPVTRKLRSDENNNRILLAVHEVRGSDRKQIDRFTVNVKDRIDTVPGEFTDMFRLTLRHPPQDADIRITWQWSRVG